MRRFGQHHIVRAHLLLTLSLVLTMPACGDAKRQAQIEEDIETASDLLAASFCERYVSETCNPEIPDLAACRAAVETALRTAQQRGDHDVNMECIESWAASREVSLDHWRDGASGRTWLPYCSPLAGDGRSGAGCSANYDCRAGLACDHITSSCKPVGQAEGDECPFSRSNPYPTFAGWWCSSGYPLLCTPDSVGDTPVCRELPGLGEPCPIERCGPGLRCSTFNGGVCEQRGERGDECEPGLDSCIDGWCPPDGVCAALPADGEPCLENGACRQGSSCEAGVCFPSALCAVGDALFFRLEEAAGLPVLGDP